MQQRPYLTVFLGVIVWLVPALSAAEPFVVDADRLRDHVRYLASDELAGRDSGEPGLEIAAEYLAREFAAIGLEPAGDGASFFQYFTVPYGAGFGHKPGAILSGDDDFERVWAAWTEAFPLSFGRGGSVVEAPVVFAGYGISTGDSSSEEDETSIDYDDFAGVDVKGKVVVILRFSPRSGTESSPLGGRRSTHASLLRKLNLAIRHGAVGVVFTTPPGSKLAGREVDSVANLQGFARRSGPKHPTLPSLIVPTAVAEEIFAAAGRDLQRVVDQIDESLKPQSFELGSLRLSFDVHRASALLRNVAARLPGKGDLASETIVVGGHYDHIGRFGDQVNRRNFGKIHNGADDNASGVAGIVEIARGLQQLDEPVRRSVEFVCFSGEEIGLLGSRHWVRSPRRLRLLQAAEFSSSAESAASGTAGTDVSRPVELEAGTFVVATGEEQTGAIAVRLPDGRSGWIPTEAVDPSAGPALLSRVVAMINLDMIGRGKGSVVNVIGGDSAAGFPEFLEDLGPAHDLEVKIAGGIGMGGSDHAHFLRRGIPALFFFTGMHQHYNQPEDDLENLNLEAMKSLLQLVGDGVSQLATRPESPTFNPHSSTVAGQSHGRPRLGVAIDPEYDGVGARVVEVLEDTPASKAKVQAGDIIRRLAEERIHSYDGLLEAISELKSGAEIAIVVDRAGERLTLKAMLPKRRGGFRVTFGSVPDYAFDEKGVRFEDIRDGSPAAEAGVKAGDVLLRWGDDEVENVAHWTGFLSQNKPGDVVRIEVRRGKEAVELNVTLRAR